MSTPSVQCSKLTANCSRLSGQPSQSPTGSSDTSCRTGLRISNNGTSWIHAKHPMGSTRQRRPDAEVGDGTHEERGAAWRAGRFASTGIALGAVAQRHGGGRPQCAHCCAALCHVRIGSAQLLSHDLTPARLAPQEGLHRALRLLEGGDFADPGASGAEVRRHLISFLLRRIGASPVRALTGLLFGTLTSSCRGTIDPARLSYAD